MDTEEQVKLIDVFNAALALKPEDRAAFLTDACGGDEALRREVESLLAHAKSEYSRLGVPAAGRFAKELLGLGELDLTGQQVQQYLIREEIGRGGMGQVFRAYDQTLRRDVAIKFLPPDFLADAGRVRRFEQEARAASALNHPNIITIHEIGQVQTEAGELQYIVMEYVAGNTLRTRLQAGKLPRDEAVDIAAQIADALSAAHHVGIVHRDIKPENIMLREDGKVKVLDFGIAKLGEGEMERRREGEKEGGRAGETTEVLNSLTRSVSPSLTLPLSTALGSVLGTVNYMSPEQARGESLDGRTDVFSVGQILLEMVTGQRLFAGREAKDVLQLLRSRQEPLVADSKLEGVSKALEPIIRKALRRTVTERYESAQQMLVALKKLQRRAATKWLRWGVAGGLIGIVLLLVMLGLAAWYSTEDVWEEKILRDGHALAVRRAVFSPDGRWLVSASDDNTVIVWDFAARKRLKTLTHHTERVRALAFSSDGKWFATGSHDKTVMVWNAATFEKVTTLREHRDAVNAVAFSPDGKWLASASSAEAAAGSDFRTVLWDTKRWEKTRELPHGVVYGPILFSSDSRWLVTNQVQWDLVSGELVVNDDLPPEKKWGGWNWAAFSPDARLLVGTGGDGDVLFRRLSPRAHLTGSRLLQKTPAHQDFGRAVAVSPDGKLVATGTDDILLWDSATRKIVSRFADVSSVWSLAFSPDGRWLVSAHGDGSLQVWDLNDRRRTAGFDGHGNHVLVVAYAPDGKRIASAGKDGAVMVWQVQTEQKEATLFGHETRIVNLAFAPDGSWLASFDQDGYLIRWDLETMVPRWKIKAHSGSACLTISPDGQWLTNPWAIYESSTGREVMRWDQMQAGLMMVGDTAFSPDGKQLAVISDRKLTLLDAQRWQRIAEQEAPANLTCVGFSPDDRSILTGNVTGTLTWWEAATLHKNVEVNAHNAALSAIVFSPDGETLASADKDEIVLWEANRRARIHSISAQSVPLYSLAFAPDGKRLAVGKRDLSVRVYAYHRRRWGQRLD